MAKLVKAKQPTESEWQQVFLRTLAGTANVSLSCKKAKISRVMAYKERRLNPNFATAWQDAIEDAVDALEQEARRRAMGWREAIFDEEGNVVRYILKYSDGLMIALLKAHRPEKYRENFTHEIKASPLKTHYDLSKLSFEELKQLEALMDKVTYSEDEVALDLVRIKE